MAYIMLLKTTIWWSHHTRTSAWSWTPSPTRWAFRSLPWPCRVRCSKSCGRHKNPPYLPSGRWSEKWKRSQQWLIGGLETWIFFDFPYWEFHQPNWLTYFSEGLKPPTSIQKQGMSSIKWRLGMVNVQFSWLMLVMLKMPLDSPGNEICHWRIFVSAYVHIHL